LVDATPSSFHPRALVRRYQKKVVLSIEIELSAGSVIVHFRLRSGTGWNLDRDNGESLPNDVTFGLEKR
jgi:hypothetical protein